MEYDADFIELKNVENYKLSVFNDIKYFLPNLGGDKYEDSQDKNQLIVSLDISKHTEELKFSLIKKNIDEQVIKIYFLHVVNLPMDKDSGWIKKLDFKL